MPRSTVAALLARRACLEPAGLPASDRDRLLACRGSRRPPRLCGWGDSGTFLALDVACLSSSLLLSLAPPLYRACRVGVPEAERRQLTVMFCDLVGSTTLSGQLDPEDYRAVITTFQRAVSEAVRRFDGH